MCHRTVEGNLDAKKGSGNKTRCVADKLRDDAARGGHSVHECETMHQNTITSICKLTGQCAELLSERNVWGGLIE